MERALILHTVQNHNILPLTSACNAKCIFCSHKGNPHGLKVITLGERKLEEIYEDITFLDAHRPIVIGESATRIIEGEPFLYPYLKQVLIMLRRVHPQTKISITTNGTLLNEEVVSFLAHEIGNMEINLSLNAYSQEIHKKIMNCIIPQNALVNGLWFKKYNLPFHGSLVAMPWLYGWDDIKNAIHYLEEIGAQSIRVFMPGYTSFSPQENVFPDEFSIELRLFIEECKTNVSIPLLCEPPFLSDFTPQIAGIIKGSPAEKSGLRPGDEILKVNDKRVFSRVDAWQRIKKYKNPHVAVRRATDVHNLTIEKKENEKSGIVCDYDLDWQRALNLRRYDDVPTLLMTSELAWPLVRQLPGILNLKNITVIPVKNQTFGGSIACAGLLTLKDILDALNSVKKTYNNLILPSEMFDYQGRDLFGEHYSLISEKHRIQVGII